MADNDRRPTDGAAPSHIHIEKDTANWMAWALLALGVLALLFALSRWAHNDAVDTMAATAPAVGNAVVAETPTAPQSAALAGTSGLGAYLAGWEPTPRTFTFEKLNFETAKTDVRPADRGDVEAVAATLTKYPNAHIRIAGYADTRGSSAANAALGKARADSVKRALVAKGINAARIETATGGETAPVDSNATPSGRAENRRTELVVTRR